MRRLRPCAILLAAALLPACQSAGAAELESILAADEAFRVAEDPAFATARGVEGRSGRLRSVAPEDLERHADHAAELLERLDAVDVAALDEQDRITHEVLRWVLEDRVQSHAFRTWQTPITSDTGFHVGFARVGRGLPFDDADDYRHYAGMLAAFPAQVEQYVANFEQGVVEGRALPRPVVERVLPTAEALAAHTPESSGFLAPYARMPASIDEGDAAQLKAEGQAAAAAALSGFATFRDYLRERYLPRSRDTIGISEVPGGEELYAHLVRHYTTLPVTADEVHAIGRDEVARIRGEMEAIIASVEFEGSFAEFLAFLRTDPRFYAKTPDELLAYASRIAKRIDARMPELFATLPRQPYGVEPVPAAIAPGYTGGRYVPAGDAETGSGTYWVNTYALESRPLYVIPALTLHEAVPGHHHQHALAAEQTDVPRFRRSTYISAHGEGWGLYSEFLGVEAGIYDDPYTDFGRLTYEMWRACRLVIDTGIHAKGWSRQQAIDFLASNSALSLLECETEIDRYISWPGQALSYKMGEIEIRRLRREAEATLGAAFDLRAFHDVILANGAVPLTTLRRLVGDWVASQSAEGNG